MLKNPPANAGDVDPWVDPLVKEMAIHSSILGNPMDRGAWRPTAHGAARLGHNLATTQQPKVTQHA